MTSTPMRSSVREERAEERRAQLAQSALATLAELGYARTSLREIAQNSQFTHGVVHYYFADKDELIVRCIRLYREACEAGFDETLLAARTAEELVDRYCAKLEHTLVHEGALHRLWYDLRTQSLYDEGLRADVLALDAVMQDLVWVIVERYATLTGTEPVVDGPTAYAFFDGLFEKALLEHLCGDPDAAVRLTERVRWLVGQVCPSASRSSITAA
jgi:AcrR family transcriptional regulator